ncbi:copper transporter 4-like [Panicum miliaceum]|uniref:Copper transporter 4-like n=1 Tax=Panicum miliaceum TaxID=4540 RepID=A0A3L6RH33_PANMI|nr:copper transporter 4-like [Panicum miliaceum]
MAMPPMQRGPPTSPGMPSPTMGLMPPTEENMDMPDMPAMHMAFFWGHRVQVLFSNWPGNRWVLPLAERDSRPCNP